ncbi:MAG TPA: YkgJ family cysteine cluster protein [Syntrophomonadaceae bacterium]|nr:YkgJ family cysteine cluster protein [Syntrophomonadaceae bacterium]HPR93390.1 YkgJ family cysteine cluster protein [Syntrophomonadaceae bacterium]
MSKIEINFERDGQDNKPAIGIRVKDKDATVADLLKAWQPLCDDKQVLKKYGDQLTGVCKGCQANCCNTAYVIPDLISFKKMAAHLKLDYKSFIEGYFDREKAAAGLLRLKPDPCIFLKDNICTIYPHRSLICRFYLCSKMLGDCEQLIYSIAWAGSAALQIFAEQNQLIKTDPRVGLSSFDLMFKQLVEEYRDKPQVGLFLQADYYDDVPLASFLK